MTTDAVDIFDELRLATPDIGARRTHLIFEASNAALLDPVHAARILKRYADPDVPNAAALFTDLTTAIDNWVDAKRMDDNAHDDDGYNRSELVDRWADDIERLAAALVPSPAVHVGPGTSTFDEPIGDGGVA